MIKKLRVADIFCGGGGISEGLRQADMEIVYGLDSSDAAIETFKNNHKTAYAIKSKIENLDYSSIPDFDILVGGPPCIEFSASKQGRGNILEGLKLVQAFLRLVHIRNPKYWIMENVPKIVMHLPEKLPLSWIGLDEPGFLDVPVRSNFLMSDYGLPQVRERFLMGRFPVPTTSHYSSQTGGLFEKADGKKEWRTLAQVLASLPSPLLPAKKSASTVVDFNYEFQISSEMLTDHFHEVELSKSEIRSLRKAKEAHPFMGWMPFPDRTDRPARTVVATQLGRETLIIGENIERQDRYRRATVRECAVLQGFPVTYQFFGSSLSMRYKIVGNSVPPFFSYLIGCEIQRQENRKFPKKPKVFTRPQSFSNPIFSLASREKPVYQFNRKFSELIPGKEVRGSRVELINFGSNSSIKPDNKDNGSVKWNCRLSVGEGKANLRQKIITMDECEELVRPLLTEDTHADLLQSARQELRHKIINRLPDANTLQASWCEKVENVLHPEELVDQLASIVDKYYPAQKYSETFVRPTVLTGILPRKGLRLRLVVGAYLTIICCEKVNEQIDMTMKESSSLNSNRERDFETQSAL